MIAIKKDIQKKKKKVKYILSKLINMLIEISLVLIFKRAS